MGLFQLVITTYPMGLGPHGSRRVRLNLLEAALNLSIPSDAQLGKELPRFPLWALFIVLIQFYS